MEVSKELKDMAYRYWCTNDIKTLLPISDPKKQEDYNNVPVFWCKFCKSLKILRETPPDPDSCDVCYATEICTGSIEEWQEEINSINNKKNLEDE